MTQYPAGGPRQPVYDLMARLGFSMSNWSDKFWNSMDGIEVSIFGAGSKARIRRGEEVLGELPLGELRGRLQEIRGAAAAV